MSKQLKIAGLAAFVICAFMAVSASAAMALPNWTVEKSGGSVVTPGTGEVNPVEIKETTEAPTLEVPGLGINLKCTTIALTGGKLVGPTEDSAEKIVFSGCEVESAPTTCQVKGATFADPVGTISTNPVTTTLKTVGTTAYDFYKPTTSPFVKLIIEKKTGKTCSVSGEYEVKGEVASSLPASGVLAASQSVSFSKAIQEAAGAALTFGAKPAFLKSIVDLKLGTGLKFGVDW
jgi:hypothetical protein